MISHYKIIKKIGEGGQAQVYLGINKKGESVKIKEFDKRKIKSFECEIENLKILSNNESIHPGISCYLDSFKQNGKYYLIMKYYDGIDLFQISSKINRSSSKYYDVLLDLLIKLLNILKYVHEYGIIHGDIKLENILILNNKKEQKSLNPVLIDFGSSCSIYDKSCMTTAGTTIYWPPEVAYYYIHNNEYQGLNEQTDVWSLGICFYELIYGDFIPRQLEKTKDISKYIINNKKKFQFNTSNKILNNLLNHMVVYEFEKRYTCEQLLNLL